MTGAAWAFMVIVWGIILGCVCIALNKIVNHSK